MYTIAYNGGKIKMLKFEKGNPMENYLIKGDDMDFDVDVSLSETNNQYEVNMKGYYGKKELQAMIKLIEKLEKEKSE